MNLRNVIPIFALVALSAVVIWTSYGRFFPAQKFDRGPALFSENSVSKVSASRPYVAEGGVPSRGESYPTAVSSNANQSTVSPLVTGVSLSSFEKSANNERVSAKPHEARKSDSTGQVESFRSRVATDRNMELQQPNYQWKQHNTDAIATGAVLPVSVSSPSMAMAEPKTPLAAETVASRSIEVAVEVPPGEDVPLVLVPVDELDGFTPQDLAMINREADRFVVEASQGGTQPQPEPSRWQSAQQQSDELFRTWYGADAYMAMQERRYLESQQTTLP